MYCNGAEHIATLLCCVNVLFPMHYIAALHAETPAARVHYIAFVALFMFMTSRRMGCRWNHAFPLPHHLLFGVEPLATPVVSPSSISSIVIPSHHTNPVSGWACLTWPTARMPKTPHSSWLSSGQDLCRVDQQRFQWCGAAPD